MPVDRFYDLLEGKARPLVTASEVARELDCTQVEAFDALIGLAKEGHLESLDVEADPTVWFPADWKDTQDRERVVVFPKRREVVVDRPSQFTRAQLSGFAHLVDTNRESGYLYRIREADVWQAPHDSFEALQRSMRQALGQRAEALEEWVQNQWERARKFRLYTHEDGYVVLEAQSPDLLGNVAEQKLESGVLRARISDTEAWVAESKTAELKRALYRAGYPVRDERHLDEGDALDVDLSLSLRPYQTDWVRRFVDTGSGVLVGPPGSGKTVAAMGVMEAVGGETLVLVPGRELAEQWREQLLANTSLTDEQIGLYHGGEKQVRPVTIATYQTAGMDRHRMLFDERRWGLIVYDEVHHIPSPIHRRSAELQTKHRLGLSATPVREDDLEREIFTLVGPPIGTDWEALFDAGYVAEPEIEIRLLPWASEMHQNEYGSAERHERRQVAAANPAKEAEIREILRSHPGAKALIFVEYIEQGDRLAEALNVPFVSGETPHARRRQLFREFKSGPRDALIVSRVGDEGIDLPNAEVAIAASGLGGSRRQGSQRAGRTMRPVGRARMYVLATLGTEEEDFARQRTRHLAGKGVQVRERESVAYAEGTPGRDGGDSNYK
ncbi:DEAD/DEAH box helicase [Salinirubellus salinus]|uniref:Putative DNA 3'-5' helicase Rad25 n=1 Tax=Salinirubellus salinus TaxID=1364945 RepID=A0A9E7R753_9EURY|nr:DEAD/DEAH box helicase [Salinirubellus salinus]UWM56847.1 DEAD/DEAH box helicase [Salinirubellus salinus]